MPTNFAVSLQIGRVYCPICQRSAAIVRSPETSIDLLRCLSGHAVIASNGPDDHPEAEIVEPGYGAGV